MNEDKMTRKQRVIAEVADMWEQYAAPEAMNRPGSKPDESFKRTMFATLAKGLTVDDYEEAIVLAMSKEIDDESVYPYFCGIVWNKAKGSQR